jgi:rhodanese-related sulfurtransferase
MLRSPVSAFREQDDGRLCVSIQGSDHDIACDFVVAAMGVKPEVELAARAGLALGRRGGIAVNHHLQTTDPDIYAIGDAAETEDPVTGEKRQVPLAGPANRQGRLVADHIQGKPATYKGTLGTSIVRIFDLTVATTGATERSLQENRMPYEKSYTHPASHAGYYPGATPMILKIIFAPDNGRLLGAQAIGVDGVDKRIDVLAAAIRARMTVEDLTELDLAYAPQYGSAKDPVNMAGYVASNILEGDIEVCHAEQLPRVLREGGFLLDVRTSREFERGHIQSAVNIPIDEIRDRHSELPADRTIHVYCLTGIRSYLVCRILQHLGFRARNLSGGYVIYCARWPSRCREIPGIRRWKHHTPPPMSGRPF